MRNLAELSAAAVGADRVELRTLQGDDPTKCVAWFDAPGRSTREISEACASLSERAMRYGEPLLLADLADDSSTAGNAETKSMIGSFMGVPLTSRISGRIAGVWSAYSGRGGAFGPEELDDWRALAWRTIWELDVMHARSRETVVQQSVREVRRIGHAVNNQLMAIVVGLDILKTDPSAHSTEGDMVDDLVAAAESIRDLIAQLREVALAAS